jgi:hypothetical protein
VALTCLLVGVSKPKLLNCVIARRLFQLSDCDPPSGFSRPLRSSESLTMTVLALAPLGHLSPIVAQVASLPGAVALRGGSVQGSKSSSEFFVQFMVPTLVNGGAARVKPDFPYD